jgi:hypothetical protein
MKYRVYVNVEDNVPTAITTELADEYVSKLKEMGIKTKLLAQSNSMDSLLIITNMVKKPIGFNKFLN